MANILYMTTFRTHADEPTVKNLTASHFSKTTWARTALERGEGGGEHNILVRLHRQRTLSEFETMGVRITWRAN